VQLHFYAIYTLDVRSVHHGKKQHKLYVVTKLRYTQLIYFLQVVTFLVAYAFRLLCADIFVFLLVASYWPNAHQLAFLIYVIVTFFLFVFFIFENASLHKCESLFPVAILQGAWLSHGPTRFLFGPLFGSPVAFFLISRLRSFG